jgi:general secretion pathway protein H
MRRPRGITLIELMVAVAIIGLIMGGALVGVRSLARSDLRGSASKLAAAIRYCFDRSITTGAYFRIVLDLDGHKYWAERSDNRLYLARDKEKSPGQGKAFDSDEADKQRDEEEEKEKEAWQSRGGQAAAALEPPPKPRRAKFQTFKDATLPTISLKKTKLFDLYTPRQREPYTSGKAYLYFFPDGHTERAVIRLTDGEDFYSLVIHPLTGKVEVKPGKYDIPKDFDTPPEVK